MVNGSNDSAPSASADWCARMRHTVDQHLTTGRLTPANASLVRGMADFCEKHACIGLFDATANLWGYGTVPIYYEAPRGGWWTGLVDLIEPTGVSWTRLKEVFNNDRDEFDGSDADVVTWTEDNGEQVALPVVANSFVVRIMLNESPWAREFADALFPTFQRAMSASGLGETLSPVVEVNPDGTTATRRSFSDFLNGGAPLPTEAEARARAFRGPAVNP
jgi:hypothetical protein